MEPRSFTVLDTGQPSTRRNGSRPIQATATEAALDPDAYTADDLRAIARTAGMMATSRMNKTELVDARRSGHDLRDRCGERRA